MPVFCSVKKLCLLFWRNCVVFQLLGLFLQRLRRLFWIMFTYLQPVYPEISEESSDARWTLCQTHLDFCLSFFFAAHTVTLHSCWWMQLKTCDLPKYRGGGWKSSDAQSTAAVFLTNYKRHKWRSPQVFCILHVWHSTENVSDPVCFTERGWYEDGLHLNGFKPDSHDLLWI